MDDSIVIERNDQVAEVVLNRPERRNALTDPMRLALLEAVRQLTADDDVAVIVLRGAGGAFCSGLDLKALADQGGVPDPALREAWVDLQVALFECDKPIVGALERYAINAGGPLVLACDHVIVGQQAFLQVGEIQQGVSPAMNLAWLVARYGDAVARRVALMGDRIYADALVRLGIATEVVADDRVTERARELAATLASYPRHAAAGIKQTLRGLGAIDDARAWFARAMELFPVVPTGTTPRVK